MNYDEGGLKHLAAAVLLQAIYDARGEKGKSRGRDKRAVEFLVSEDARALMTFVQNGAEPARWLWRLRMLELARSGKSLRGKSDWSHCGWRR